MATILHIEHSQHQGRVPVTVFQIQGEIDASSYEQLQTEANQAVEKGTRNLVLDLGKVTYISSAGLRAIHTISNLLVSHNRTETNDAVRRGMRGGTFKSPYLKLLNPSPDVREALSLMGFDMFLEMYGDLREAIASF